MKLFLSVFLLVLFTQDINGTVFFEGSIIPTITDQLLGGLPNLLDSTVKGAGRHIIRLDPTVSNLVTSVLRTVVGLVDDLLFLAESLLAEVHSSDRVVDDCVNRTRDLELVKQKTSDAVANCTKKLEAEKASVSVELKKESDRGNAVISSAAISLSNCLKGLYTVSCLSKTKQSADKEIQDIIKNVQKLTARITLASDEAASCLNEAEENGCQSANQIYQEIQNCISKVPK